MADGIALKGGLGFNTVMLIQMTALLFWVQWCVVCLCVFPLKSFDRVTVLPAVFLGLYFLAANVLNRARVKATRLGIDLRFGPVPLPGFRHRFIPAANIAEVYATASAIGDRYGPGFTLSRQVHVFTKEGESVPVLRSVGDVADAKTLAAMMQAETGPISGEQPVLRGAMRTTGDMPPQFQGSVTIGVVLLSGFLLVAAVPLLVPFLRTVPLVKAPGVISRVEQYADTTCYVLYTSIGGTPKSTVVDDCPHSSQPKDRVNIYYDPEHPGNALLLNFACWPLSAAFGLLGAGGILVSVLRRRRPKFAGGFPLLAEDLFIYLDRYWGFAKGFADGDKGVLTVRPRDGLAFFRPWHRYAFGSVDVEVRVRSRDSGDSSADAGILFWARDQNSGFIFTARPRNNSVEVLQVVDGQLTVYSQPVSVSSFRQGAGEWNVLRVELRAKGATFFLNGLAAGTLAGEAPPGGGMAGLYAFRPKGSQTYWEFSEFRVYQTRA